MCLGPTLNHTKNVTSNISLVQYAKIPHRRKWLTRKRLQCVFGGVPRHSFLASSLVPRLLGGGVREKKEPGAHCLRTRYLIRTFWDTGYFLLMFSILWRHRVLPCIKQRMADWHSGKKGWLWIVLLHALKHEHMMYMKYIYERKDVFLWSPLVLENSLRSTTICVR